MFISTILTASACTSEKAKSGTEPGALASVNGNVITEDDRYLLLEGGHGQAITPETQERALQDLIEQELLYQQGLKLDLDKDPKFRNAVRVMEMRLRAFKRSELARRVISTRIAATVNISDEDARRYYEQNKEMISTELHLMIQRFGSEQEAAAVWAGLQSGRSFDGAGAGGNAVPAVSHFSDQGFLKWNQIPVEWAEQLYSLKKGDISTVLTSKRAGICIARLIGRRKDPEISFDRANASIMSRLRDIRIEEAYVRYLSDLKKQARIMKYDERRKTP